MTETSAMVIRDAAHDLLGALLPGIVTKTKTGNRTFQPSEFPALSVFVLDETRSPLGDANAGEPHFLHMLRLGIIVSEIATSNDLLNDVLDARMQQVETILLNRSSWGTSNGEGPQIFDGIERMVRSTRMPQPGGEVYAGDLLLEVTISFRTYWDPVVPDAFRELAIIIEPNGDSGATISDPDNTDPSKTPPYEGPPYTVVEIPQ